MFLIFDISYYSITLFNATLDFLIFKSLLGKRPTLFISQFELMAVTINHTIWMHKCIFYFIT